MAGCIQAICYAIYGLRCCPAKAVKGGGKSANPSPETVEKSRYKNHGLEQKQGVFPGDTPQDSREDERMATLDQLKKKAEKMGLFTQPDRLAYIENMGTYYECTIVVMDRSEREKDITRYETLPEAMLYAENHANITLMKDYGEGEEDGKAQDQPENEQPAGSAADTGADCQHDH